jgi:hypothetical protein
MGVLPCISSLLSQHRLRDCRSQLSRTGVECAIRGAERRGGEYDGGLGRFHLKSRCWDQTGLLHDPAVGLRRWGLSVNTSGTIRAAVAAEVSTPIVRTDFQISDRYAHFFILYPRTIAVSGDGHFIQGRNLIVFAKGETFISASNPIFDKKNDDRTFTGSVRIGPGKSSAEFRVPIANFFEILEDGLTQGVTVILQSATVTM